MIKRKQMDPYRSKVWPIKVEYSTADGIYCTVSDVNVPLTIPDFSIRKIITQQLRVDKDKGYTAIGYGMITVHDILVKLFLITGFNCNFP